MNILSLIQPSELGPDFRLEEGVWKVNFPTSAAPPPPISNDARNTVTNTPEGMFIDKRDRLAYALVQDSVAQKIRLYEYPADEVFTIGTAALVSDIDMLGLNGQFDDVAIDEAVITFTDVQTGLTLTLNTIELQRVGNIQSTNGVSVTETAGILYLTAKIDPNTSNLLEVTASGLQVTQPKIAALTNTKLAVSKIHTQEMSTLSDGVIGHVVGDQILEIPKIVVENSSGALVGLINDPEALIKSSRYYRELTFKMTGGEYGDYIYIGNMDLYDPITGIKNVDTTLVINWGDGSPIETLVGDNIYDAYHEYLPGHECIATFMFDRMVPMFNPQGTAIKEVISFGITPILNPRFEYCNKLIQVPDTLPPYVTSLERMFESTDLFNGSNILLWNTINVTNLERTFQDAVAFNQPIGNWDISNVTNLRATFYNANAFNQPLNQWNTSNVTNMRWTFAGTWSFDGDISTWNTSKVTDMWGMFYRAGAFNQPVNSWDVSNVTTMHGMFQETDAFNQDISNWNTINVIDMGWMFYQAVAYNQDLSNLCVSKITYTPEGFATGANNWVLPRPVWGTCPSGIKATMQFTTMAGNLTYQGSLGDVIELSDGSRRIISNTNATSYSVPLGTHTVKLMGTRSSNEIKLYGPALSTVKTFPEVSTINKVTFEGSNNLISVPVTLPANITNCSRMFRNCIGFNSDISGWDVTNVTNMSYMFNLAGAFNRPIGNWNVSNVTDMNSMFCEAGAFNQPIGNWNVSNVTNMASMFEMNYTGNPFNQPLDLWDTSKVTDMRNMFKWAGNFNQPIGNWNVSNVTNMSGMFYDAHAFDQDISNWNVSKVTTMNSMFLHADTFNKPLNTWDLSSVTNISSMFFGAGKFNQPIGNWNVSNVTDMYGVFINADVFNQPIGNWNVSKVTKMTSMFEYAYAFNQPLNQWCVAFIATQPPAFSTSSPLTAANKPVWGTCPRGENLV